MAEELVWSRVVEAESADPFLGPVAPHRDFTRMADPIQGYSEVELIVRGGAGPTRSSSSAGRLRGVPANESLILLAAIGRAEGAKSDVVTVDDAPSLTISDGGDFSRARLWAVRYDLLEETR